MVVQGWAELVAWMQERSAAGALDVEAVWEQFRTLAATSEQPGLPALAGRFDAAPAKDRLALAATVAGMLGPVEWPVTWREPRRRLIDALTELLVATSDETPESSPLVLDLDTDQDLYMAGRFELSRARDLLYIPCRRDELRLVARFCMMGTWWSWRALSRRRSTLDKQSSEKSLREALERFRLAFATYAEAGRSMNAACGAALFVNLHLPAT